VARRAGTAALLVAALALGCGDREAPAASDLPLPPGGVRVTIGDDVVRAEVVRSAEEKARGLGGRDGLAPGTGMLFVFDEPGFPAFWMQGMRFDLDLVWARDGRIVDVSADVPRPPPGPDPNALPLPVYRPREPANLVLEVPAGTAAASGWRVGDRLEIEPPVAVP
jgi:uncharacterized membrane protein (UPF0127 family)